MGHNPLHVASTIGLQSNGEFGQRYLESLEMAYILRAIKHRTYTDEPERLLQNLLVIAPPGAGKTFLADQFLSKGIGGIDVFSDDSGNSKNPRVLRLTKSVSWERARGTCNSMGEVIPPLLCDSEFVLAGELLDFMGGERERGEKMDQLNVATEEGRITVSLVKMGELDDEAADEVRSKLSYIPGFHYNSRLRGFSYDVRSAFIACTRAPDRKTEKDWRTSGFLSRFDVYWWEPDDDEYLAYLVSRKRSPDFSQLRPANEQLWRTKFLSIPKPPESLLEPMRDWIGREYQRINKTTDQPVTGFGNLRDMNAIPRAIVASAVARVIASRSPSDTSPVETLTYTQEDADFAKRYFEPRISHTSMKVLVEAASTQEGEDNEWAVEYVRSYMHANFDRDTTFTVSHSKLAILKHVTTKLNKKIGSARNGLVVLKRQGLITYGRGADGVVFSDRLMNLCGYVHHEPDDHRIPDDILEIEKASEEIEIETDYSDGPDED